MAVQSDPYHYWEDERENSDYRSRQTQASSLTRQMLRQVEYLRNSNRVNPGPSRNVRAIKADLIKLIPHFTINEDIWGWQAWSDRKLQLSESLFSDSLLEQNTINPGELSLYSELPETTTPQPIPMDPPASVVTTRRNLKSVQFDQINPSQNWSITHNLGYYPSVELFNQYWNEIDGNVVHVNKNFLRVELTAPISGHARLV